MSQKCKEMRQFRGALNVTQDSKIIVNNSYIAEATTDTSIAQKANYKAYTVRYTNGKKQKPTKIQQTPRNHLIVI